MLAFDLLAAFLLVLFFLILSLFLAFQNFDSWKRACVLMQVRHHIIQESIQIILKFFKLQCSWSEGMDPRQIYENCLLIFLKVGHTGQKTEKRIEAWLCIPSRHVSPDLDRDKTKTTAASKHSEAVDKYEALDSIPFSHY